MNENRYRQIDDRFSRFMFGDRPRRDHHSQEDELITEMSPSKTEEGSSDVPYWELMENIDNIMTTLSSFKPLVNKVTPFIDKFLSKKK